jgi:hypothetical protein
MATANLVHFPRQSKSSRSTKKHPREKCTVLEWIRNGYHFPGVPLPPPPDPSQPKPEKPPQKPEEAQ